MKFIEREGEREILTRFRVIKLGGFTKLQSQNFSPFSSHESLSIWDSFLLLLRFIKSKSIRNILRYCFYDTIQQKLENVLPFYWNCLNSSSHVSCVYPVRDIRACIFFVFFRDLFSIYFFLCVFIHSLYPPTTSQIVFFVTPNLLYSVLVSFVLHPSRFIFIISS